jgi:predicted glycosyl hydrolase (DUF1957 family)
VKQKYFLLVLHSHIPYVIAHGSWPHGMDWLYEAAAESYLPLLDVFFKLMEEGLSPQINISFTPVLMDQLKSSFFLDGFEAYLKMKIEAAEHYERSSALLAWLQRGNALSPEDERLLQSWELEDGLFEELVTTDGKII